MDSYTSINRKTTLENRYEDFVVISFLLKKNNIEVPDDVEQGIKDIENELQLIEDVYERFNEVIFYKTVYAENEEEITFEINTSGCFLVYENGEKFLLGRNPENDVIHLIKLTNDYYLDSEWLENNNMEYEEDDEFYDDYSDYNDMPCDLDSSECGVTCFNCPRGN